MNQNRNKLYLLCALAVASSACSEGTSDSICEENAYQCVSNALWRCNNGVFDKVEECSSNATCNATTQKCEPNADTPTCQELTKRCNDSRSAVEICKNGQWTVDSPCLIGTICDAQKLECASSSSSDTDECRDNEAKCENNALYACNNKRWMLLQTCQNEQTCDATTKTCVPNATPTPDCTNGSFKCDGTKVYECRAEKWVHLNTCIASQETCDATTGTCHKIEVPSACTDGAKRCSSDSSAVEICENSNWIVKDENKCATGQICLGGSCMATSSCTGNDAACEKNTLVQCINGAQKRQDCGDRECIERDGSATCESFVCSDGQTQCKNLATSQICRNNQWEDAACGSDEICLNGSCVAQICTENDLRCNNNAVEICQNNAWIVKTPCTSTQMCQNQACIAIVCNDGDKRCNGNTLQVCTQNAYTDEKSCGSDICTATAKSAECQPRVCTEGDYRCSSNNLESCIDNAWEVSQKCGSSTCNANLKTCVNNACTDGAVKCSNSAKSVMICENGSWKTQSSCSKDNRECKIIDGTATCVAPSTDTCKDGVSCSGNTQIVCNNGEETKKDCMTQTPPGTCQDGNCIPFECTGSDYKCDGNLLKQCDNTTKTYKTVKTCNAATEACNATTKTCDAYECTGDGFICDGNTLQKCNNHKYEEVEKCGTDKICDASTHRCIEKTCETGDYSCNGKVLRNCVKNAWKDSQTCSAKQECDALQAKCIDHECEGADYSCDGKQLQRCQNYKTVNIELCSETESCDASQKKCIPHECESQTQITYCDGVTLKTCENYKITSSTTCSSTQLCDASQKKCIPLNCTAGQYSCNAQKLQKCVNNSWVVEKTCNENETCNAKTSTCDLTPVCTPNEMRCNGNAAQKCNSTGQWETLTSGACHENQVCVQASNTQASCIDKWAQPTWCRFQYLDTKTGRAYGRILVPDSVNRDDIQSELICGTKGTALSTWKYTAKGVVNANCTDCYANTEYMTYSLDAPVGNYTCAFRLKYGPQNIICNTIDANNNYLIEAGDTVLDDTYLREYQITPPGDDPIAWCRAADAKQNEAAYIQVLLPDNVTPAQAKAELICGNASSKPSTWTTKFETTQNLFCGAACGANTEYMTSNVTAKTSQSCASVITINGKMYACPNGGGTPKIFSVSDTLEDAYLTTPHE